MYILIDEDGNVTKTTAISNLEKLQIRNGELLHIVNTETEMYMKEDGTNWSKIPNHED